MRDHFLCNRSLDDIFTIAADEWGRNIRRLNELQSEIDPRMSWQDLYHGFFPPEIKNTDMTSLYRGEIERLREFFKDRGFDQSALNSPLVFAETPTYLRSVRGTASFSAAFSPDAGEKSIFFLTSRMSGQGDKQTVDRINRRLHREYKFLTAHEAVPGHHLLDSIRRRLANPVRRQIESPFFYEGWASYAESLLIDYGYVQTPLEYLVDFKRRLWRCARCQIDTGLPAGLLDRHDAENLLTTAGFSQGEAERQIDRFQLNPGYQICYTLGRYEIIKLQQAYADRMGREAFHRFLLEGGQLPFHLNEKRFEAFNSRGG